MSHISERERRWQIAVLLFVAFIYCAGLTIADPDLWGHTLYGLRCLDRGLLVEPDDPFSYSAPRARWVNHEWLSEYQYGWLWRRAGTWGLVGWKLGCLAIVFLTFAWVWLRPGASVAAAAVLLMFGSECLGQYATFIRPQLATFAAFAVTLSLWRHHWDHPASRVIWWTPVIMLAWVNLHGGFLAGVAIVVLFVAAWGLRLVLDHRAGRSDTPATARAVVQVAAVLALTLGSTFVNPYGVELHTMLWDHLVPEQAVREWQPLWRTRQSPMYYVPFVMLGLAFSRSRKTTWIDVLLLTAIGFQAVSHLRHGALLCITCVLLLREPLAESLSRIFPHFTETWGEASRWKTRWAGVAFAACALFAFQFADSYHMVKQRVFPWEIGVEARRECPGMPVRAIEWLAAEGIAGNLLTDYGWGQYVIWHLHPQVRIGFDGRYRTIYGADLEREFLAFTRIAPASTEPMACLDRWGTDLVLWPVGKPVVSSMRRRDEWCEIFDDGQAVLFVRREGRFADVVKRKQAGEISLRDVATWQRFPAGPVTHDKSNSTRDELEGERGRANDR